jgi:hypothetical protein
MKWGYSLLALTAHMLFSVNHSLCVLSIAYLCYYHCCSTVNWAAKAQRRKAPGTGRMRYLKNMTRRFKNGFREGTTAKKIVKA